LAIDLHHIIEVNEEGTNDLSNLLALCPTCHALYTRGTISKDSINVWKTILVALNHAFDRESISNLLFLKSTNDNPPPLSGDGVLKFSHLIASGLAEFHRSERTGIPCTVSVPNPPFEVVLTPKGNRIIDAWYSGNREEVKQALLDIDPFAG
jgi:hypothetical protein